MPRNKESIQRKVSTFFALLLAAAFVLTSCGGGPPKFSNPGPLSTLKATEPSNPTSTSATTNSPQAVEAPTSSQSSSRVAPTSPSTISTLPQIALLPPSGAGTANLAMYQSGGGLYSFRQFRSLESNNTGNNGYDDATLNPSTLQVVDLGPFYQGPTTVAVDLSISPAAISFAWPSDRGYSNLICDLPGGGSFNLDALCIRSQLVQIAAMAKANSYPLSQSQSESFTQLQSDIDPTLGSSVNQQQLNQAVDLSLDVANSIATNRIGGVEDSQFRYSVTIDTLDNLSSTLNAVRSTFPSRAMVRIVIDPGVPLSQYQSAIDLAHSMSISVMIELMDSQYMASYSYARYQSRIDQILSTLQHVDVWEVGNEVNGNWLGPQVGAKVAYAIDKAASLSSTPLYLTLYWQLGEDDASHSIFNWVNTNLTPTEISKLTSVGISMYPQEAPLGASFYRAMTTLHTVYFPNQSIYIGELGYGGSGVTGSWWWGSPSVSDSSKASTVTTYMGLLLSLPFSVSSGPFWWYFAEEYASSPQLIAALRNWYRQ